MSKYFLLIMLLLSPTHNYACSCVSNTSIKEEYESHDIVVIGEITEMEKRKDPFSPFIPRGIFKRLITFKGDSSSITYINGRSRRDGNMCKRAVKFGTYIIFTNIGDTINLSTCSRTRLITKEEKETLIDKFKAYKNN